MDVNGGLTDWGTRFQELLYRLIGKAAPEKSTEDD